MKNENKQKILDLLLPALQITRDLSDLVALEYDKKTEIVTAHFINNKKQINVAADSGIAMIRDIVRHIS